MVGDFDYNTSSAQLELGLGLSLAKMNNSVTICKKNLGFSEVDKCKYTRNFIAAQSILQSLVYRSKRDQPTTYESHKQCYHTRFYLKTLKTFQGDFDNVLTDCDVFGVVVKIRTEHMHACLCPHGYRILICTTIKMHMKEI